MANPPTTKPSSAGDPDIGKVIWMKCRGKRGCENNEAKIVMKFKLPQGGQSIRYRCTQCGRPFHIIF